MWRTPLIRQGAAPSGLPPYYAAAHGHRKFRAVAVAGGRDGVTDEYCAPCGVCRQVLREFSDPEELMVLLVRSENDFSLSDPGPAAAGELRAGNAWR